MTQTNSPFSSWGLSEDLLQAIQKLGYETPTPVQEQVIPALLEVGGDVIVLAKTGTGKTAAFGIPLLEKIEAGGGLQSLVLCPTRELATQVAQNLIAIGSVKKIKVTSVLGGESYRRQIDSLSRNPEVVVSTPGRLVDLIEQGIVSLNAARFLVLDEADEMLSFGFQESLEKIRQDFPSEGVQTWLFSATMSASVQNLSKKILNSPRKFMISGGGEASRQLSSFAAVVFEEDKEKALKLLLQKEPDFYGIIFAQTKKQVADLEHSLRPLGLGVESLHGDKPQVERHRVLDKIKSRQSRILVATDVAARGLDIQDLTHVVNFEIPWDVETYTHRIGRTARAGKQGTVWTLVRPKEAPKLRKFERALNFKFENLRIPSQKEIVANEVRGKLAGLFDLTTDLGGAEYRFYDEILGSFEKDRALDLNQEVRGWLLRFLKGSGLHAKITGQDPRSFELRTDDGPPRLQRGDRSRPPMRTSDDRRGGGGFGARRESRDSREGGFAPRRRFDDEERGYAPRRRFNDEGGGDAGGFPPRRARSTSEAGSAPPRARRQDRSEGYAPRHREDTPRGEESGVRRRTSSGRSGFSSAKKSPPAGPRSSRPRF